MIPLIFAAALTVSPALAQPASDAGFVTAQPLSQLRTLGPSDLMGRQLECEQTLSKTLGPDGLPLKKLGDLPPALEEHAVLRMVRGCPVLEVVYEGQIYYFQGPVGGMEYDLHGRVARHY